jgi:oxygen-dependent protoporphyrinogen oxidase
MAELPLAIGRSLGDALRLKSRVDRIEFHADAQPTGEAHQPAGEAQWSVDVMEEGRAQRYRARAVILASPAAATAGLLEPLAPQAAHALRAIPYAPIVIVGLGLARGDVGHPLDGFGCLLPGREGSRLLGSLWSSTIFPGRAPEGMVALTNYLAGAKRPELAKQSDAELIALTLEELRRWLGVTGAPRVTRVVRWPRAIPQYTLGHADRLAAVEQAVEKWPTLSLVGNYLRGVSVPDNIVQAKEAADRLADRLRGEAPRGAIPRGAVPRGVIQ